MRHNFENNSFGATAMLIGWFHRVLFNQFRAVFNRIFQWIQRAKRYGLMNGIIDEHRIIIFELFWFDVCFVERYINLDQAIYNIGYKIKPFQYCIVKPYVQ